MDEAILRIKLEGGGGGTLAGAPSAGQRINPPAGSTSTAQKAFDAFAEANKRRQAVRREAEVQNILDVLMGREPPMAQAVGSKVAGQGVAPSILGQIGKVGGGIGEAIGGIAAAAGPVGIAVAAIAAFKLVTDAVAGTIKAFGNFTAMLISPSNDPSQFTSELGSAISSFSDAIFFVSPILGAMGKIGGAFVEVLGKLMQAMDGLVQRYAQYSPGLAAAQAQAEVTQVLGDIRRAREAEPALVRYIQARTELQQKIEDMKIRIMTKLEPMIVAGVGIVEQLLPIVEGGFDVLTKYAENFPFMRQIIQGIRDEMERRRHESNSLSDEILSQAMPRFPFGETKEGASESPIFPR